MKRKLLISTALVLVLSFAFSSFVFAAPAYTDENHLLCGTDDCSVTDNTCNAYADSTILLARETLLNAETFTESKQAFDVIVAELEQLYIEYDICEDTHDFDETLQMFIEYGHEVLPLASCLFAHDWIFYFVRIQGDSFCVTPHGSGCRPSKLVFNQICAKCAADGGERIFDRLFCSLL